ncbi:MAG: HD domain-containing protein [Spirochaetota bacterium]
MQLLQALAQAGFATYIVGPSALPLYFTRRSVRRRNEDRSANPAAGNENSGAGSLPAVIWVETEASLVDLSRLFGEISFPGATHFDAALESGQTLVLFRCIEPGQRPGQVSLQGAFRFELRRGVFQDPLGAYPFLRDTQLRFRGAPAPETSEPAASDFDDIAILEIALLIARCGYELPPKVLSGALSAAPPASEPPQQDVTGSRGPAGRLSPIEQRFLLAGILTGAHSAAALQFLMDSGFISRYWPLLADMDSVPHSKEHHPEGNVWKHTLETFSYRKVYELELGIGLLLHDCGKPYAQPQGGNRFDQHAQIGSQKTRRFLEQLQFPHSVIQAAEYLVKNHMLPSAISSLPTFRTEEVMASPMFPELLELYRCDVSSTFRGPEGYYRACKTYRAFLKNRRNPFRSSDGKKRLRLLVE